MADDVSQDQTQITEPQQPTVPPTDQLPVESQPTQPALENPVVSETPITPTPPNSPSSEPVIPPTSGPQTAPQSVEEETPAPIETSSQPVQTPVIPPAETQQPISPPVLDIPKLHFPFSGNFPVTFSFGQQSDNEEIKKKFQEWGIVGHNGLDFGMSVGNEVFPCDVGKVIQSGDNGDFGTSITIQHSWGQSLYAHLSESKVKVDDEIQPNKVIGLSGSSGSAFGEHLHFAIKPNNPDPNNGYLGFIDPSPYLSLSWQKEETSPVQTPPVEEQKPVEETKSPEPVIPQPEPTPQQPSEPEPTINIEPEKRVEPSQIPQTPQIPQVSNEEIQKQVDEKLKTELDARRLKANQARQTKREENLMKIEKLIEEKKQINNNDVCDLLHVAQSTATNYLEDLVKRGTVKLSGNGKATTYSY